MLEEISKLIKNEIDAFYSASQLELETKALSVQYQGNFGQIFRSYNLVLRKPLGTSLSINDFYKAYGHTCFLLADIEKIDEIDPQEIMITYVCHHYPQDMLEHIGTAKHIFPKKRESGIYDLEGDPFVIQLIVTSELSPKYHFLLHFLRNTMKPKDELLKLKMITSPKTI